MKALICTDLEGVSGVTSFQQQCKPEGKYYEQAKNLLTGEVNAAVEALTEKDISDILVFDGHGAGGINYEKLHPAARLLHGRPLGNWRQLFKGYDVTIMIGQHSMANTEKGCLAHTQNENSVVYYKLNGKYIGEIAQWALLCGALEIPLVFLSGDKAACNEACQLIPQITTVTVKEGISNTSAISLPPATAQLRISQGVKTAIEGHRKKPVLPLKWNEPYELEICFLNTEGVDNYKTNPLAERLNPNTVKLKSENIWDIIYS